MKICDWFQIPLNEVVEPPEFEDFVLQNQPLNENDPDSKMLEFPDDDIEVTTIPRHCRTVQRCIPKDAGYVLSVFPIPFLLVPRQQLPCLLEHLCVC